jgi:hypothetical protein
MKKKACMTAALAAIALMAAFASSGCASAAPAGRSYPGGEAEYARLGLSKAGVEPWEDGIRTSGGKGSFEWWYFDVKNDDGSALVIGFYTKGVLDVDGKLAPMVTVTLTNADGSVALKRVLKAPASEFSASKESCDVRIGKNAFTGDLKKYRIVLDFDGVKADIALSGETPAWRPATGCLFFESGKRTSYFAWLPSVPRGRAIGSLESGGTVRKIDGSGYHDHNWGDASMLEQMHDWYWGRAAVGPYTIITAYITSAQRYGGAAEPFFLLARDGKVLADDGGRVKCSLEGIYTDAKTRKPVARTVRYDYDDGTSRYRVTFERERDIERVLFADQVSGFERFMAWLIGFDGAYLRFTGKVTVERLEGGAVSESVSQDDAVWELMYFGKAPKAGTK